MYTPDEYGLFEIMEKIATMIKIRVPEIAGCDKNLRTVRVFYKQLQKRLIVEGPNWCSITAHDFFSNDIDLVVATAAALSALEHQKNGHPVAETMFGKAISAFERIIDEIQKKQTK